MRDEQAFADFVHTSSPELLRAAWLLTGDWHAAHDLVQSALEKTWPRWGRDIEHPEAYVRRVMVTTYLRWRRRRWTGEMPTEDLPETIDSGPDSGPDTEAADLRRSLREALSTLTARQRAVVVLRYFEDLTEAQTAAVLDCSVGSVKTHASRGLGRLRSVPMLAAEFGLEASNG